MSSASIIRLQIETALAHRIPSALTPIQKLMRPVAPTGVSEVDELLEGGLLVGAITEIIGPESSGEDKHCTLLREPAHPCWEGMRVGGCIGCALSRIRGCSGVDFAICSGCGAELPKRRRSHPSTISFHYREIPDPCAHQDGIARRRLRRTPAQRSQRTPRSCERLLRPEAIAPRCAEPQRRVGEQRETFAARPRPRAQQTSLRMNSGKPWARIEQALRATDLLLQAGGFSAIVLDMASVAPEYASRVPLATWFRYRAAAERTQAVFLLLTQHSCAKSSGELLLRFPARQGARRRQDGIHGNRTPPAGRAQALHAGTHKRVPLRKPPQRADAARWKSQTTWAGAR